MPSSDGRTDAQLVAAVRAGELDESVIDTAAGRAIALAQKAVAGARADATYDVDAHHALAREAAAASIRPSHPVRFRASIRRPTRR